MSDSHQRRAVVVDDQPLWLEAIERVLGRVGFETIHTTTSPEDALAAVEREQPDLLVVGMGTEAAGDFDCPVARTARDRSPGISIIVLGENSSSEAVEAAFSAGVNAYALKTVDPDDFAAAVRQSFRRSIYFRRPPLHQPPLRRARPALAEGLLTRREAEILRLVADGHSNGSLAHQLWVTEQTVKFHLSNIYRKLGVANRTEASRWAQVHGLLDEGRAEAVPAPAFAPAAS